MPKENYLMKAATTGKEFLSVRINDILTLE
jgi:hypothetical protein